MTKFTVEETNLICIFDTSRRQRAIGDMKNISLNDLDDEMQELLYRTVSKLEEMTDEEFSRISFTPADLIDERSE